MTRDRRTLSAVFMAVLLVLASGTAVSLAVTGSSTTDAGTNAAALQETTTAQATETAEEAPETTEEAGATTQEDGGQAQEGQAASFEVESLDLPVEVTLGENVTVNATISNPNEQQASQLVQLRVDGNLLAQQNVTLDAGEETTVAFDVGLGNATTGQHGISVLTPERGSFALITVTGQDEETTTEAAEQTTTTTEAVEETTEAVEQTTTEAVEETTTTEEEGDAEETTTEAVEQTTTEAVEETTTEAAEQTTTVQAPAGQERFVFQVEQMTIDRWSFVVGDEETPDRTETVGNLNVTDRRVTINLTQILQQANVSQDDLRRTTTQSPEQIEEQLEQNLTQDIPTVRYVITNVHIENVTFVITAPENVELPEPPMTTTTTEETTTEEVEETTTEAAEQTTTTTEEDGGAEETTTEAVGETTTTTEAVEETTTEVVEETTTEAVEQTTTEAAEGTTTTADAGLDSFEVSNLNAPATAPVGETIQASATITNPNDQQATQSVAFRLEGTVLARQNVTLDAGEQTTVTFEVDTSGVPPGQYIHGVYTQSFGNLTVIMLEEPTEGTTTAAEGNGAETTTAAEGNGAETTTATEA